MGGNPSAKKQNKMV